MKRILVIKLGALGDVVMAMPAFKRIREAHPMAEITVLTTPAYRVVFEACPWVDRVETDGRPKGMTAFLALVLRLRAARYDRIYDLQTSSRSSALHLALQPFAPPWSGIAAGAALPHRNPARDRMHALEQKIEQLEQAGIWPDAPTAPGCGPPPELDWAAVRGDPVGKLFGLTRPYALLLPGGSAHRLGKRWPVERYAELAQTLKAEGLDVGVVRGPPEAELAAAIPAAKDTGMTDFFDIAALGANAAVAIGNDTGPTHIVTASGAPTVALFSGESDPVLTAPRGPRVEVLRRAPLSELSVGEALAAVGRVRAG